MFRFTIRRVLWLIPLLLTATANAESFAPFADYREPCHSKGVYFLVEYTGKPEFRSFGGPTRITVAKQRDLKVPNAPCTVRLTFQQGAYVVADQRLVKVADGDTVLRTFDLSDIPEQVTVDPDSLRVATLGWYGANRAKLAKHGAIQVYSNDNRPPWVVEMSQLFPDAIDKCAVSRSTVDWLHSAWFDSLDGKLVVLGHKCCSEKQDAATNGRSPPIVVLETDKRTVSPGTLDYLIRAATDRSD